MEDVKVKCRKCGRTEASSNFTLDPVYKMVVCSTCIKERKKSEQQQKEPPKEQPQKAPPKNVPPGWDADDEYLEKKNREQVPVPGAAPRPDGKISCKKCKYAFRYDAVNDKPKVCPYCGTLVKGRRF